MMSSNDYFLFLRKYRENFLFTEISHPMVRTFWKEEKDVLIALLLTSRVVPVQAPKVYQCSKYTKAEGVVHCGCTV